MKFNLIYFLIVLNASILAYSSATTSSTFVGNGGNAGDLELKVSKETLKKTLEIIRDDNSDGNDLCTCPVQFSQHPYCANLESLNESQKNFCNDFIKSQAPQLLDKIEKAHFIWTDSAPSVREQGQLLSVDAIADYQNQKVLLFKDRVINLASFERNFLLSHELFHLTLFNGKPIVDEAPIGPYKSAIGGRELLNAAATVLVLKSNEWSIAPVYKVHLERSRQDRRFWLGIDYAGFRNQEDLGTSYAPEKYSGMSVSARYFFADWLSALGVGFKFGNYSGQSTLLSTVNADDRQSFAGLGALYKWDLFSNKLSFWGQSFFQFGVYYEQMKTKFTLEENQLGARLRIEDEATVGYFTGDLSFYIPMRKGFWLNAGLQVSQPRYGLNKEVDLRYSQVRTTTNIGVSYGF